MEYAKLSSAQQTALLYGAVTKAAEKAGYERHRAKDTGGAQIIELHRNGEGSRAAIKTSRNRWFAVVPLGSGKWKTLDDADALLISTVDSETNPKTIQLYKFPAEEVRKRLDAALKARTDAGHQIKLGGFGLWISLDTWSEAPYDTGSGLSEAYPPIATISLSEISPPDSGDVAASEQVEDFTNQLPVATMVRPQTVADVLRVTREQISALTGVNTDMIKLDLKIEY